MSPLAQLQAFAQSVYLLIKNRYYDDLTSADGVIFMAQIADFINQFIDELETETDPTGEPLDWSWVRQPNYTLGTAVTGDASVSIPTAVNNLITQPGRYVQVLQDGTAVSNWAVVSPNEISNKTDRITEDMVASIGGNLIFSRVFKDTENNGTIVGDVTTFIPKVVYNSTTNVATNVKALTVIKPLQLLKLGVAKNASLPDIVQGKLSPSYAQKYNDLLTGAIARNMTSSQSDEVGRDDFSYVAGVGF